MAEIKIKKDYSNLVVSIIILVIGLLFCFSRTLGEQALSVILGISFIVFGAIIVLLPIMQKKQLLTPEVIFGCLAIAFGIYCIVNNIVGIILGIIPWILIVIGSIAIIDSLLMILQRKQKNIPVFVFEIILGTVLVTLGICLLVVSGFADVAGIIFGVALIVYAIFQIINIMIEKKKK